MASDAFDQVGGAIGFADTVFGVFGQITDAIFPDPDAASLNNFRVHVGLVRANDTQGDSRSTDGDAPALAAWDAAGNFLAQVTPDGNNKQKIDAGGFRNYGIEGRQGADYLSVVRTGNDGICISLITGVTANTGRQSMWTGDLGKACGAPWYEQANPVSDAQPPYVPACVWLDGNGDEGHIWKGFNFHLGSFPGTNTEDSDVANIQNLLAGAWSKDRRLLCNSEPLFSLYEEIEIGTSIRTFVSHPATGGDPGTPGYADNIFNEAGNWAWEETPPPTALEIDVDGTPKGNGCIPGEECPPKKPSWTQTLPVQEQTRRRVRRRLTEDEKIHQIRKRQVIHADRLIISKIPQHSAIGLCDSPYSLGPDMVSWTEGMFCDMSEKRLWPICSDSSASYCFDMDSQTVKGSERSSATADTPLWSNSSSGAVTPSVAVAVSGNPADASLVVPNKSYSTVTMWDP